MKRTTIAIALIVTVAALACAVWLQVSQSERAASPNVAAGPEAIRERPTLGEAIRQWMLLPWRDANGNIPAGRTAEALTAREEYLNSGLDADGFGELAVSHLRWRSHGPNNIGGRTRQVIVHPTRSDILWAAAIGGGVWKSTDRGETWTATNGGLENYVVTSLALDPNSGPDYDTLYAGTGENGYSGGGIFKSTDGGESWTLKPNTAPSGNCPGSDWCTVYRIAVQPGASNVVLASNGGGIWRSVNGGNNWTQHVTGQGDGSRFVAFDPNNGLNAVAELINAQGSAVVKYSTDGGEEWLSASRNDIGTFAVPARIELAYGYQGPNAPVVYAVNQVGDWNGEVSRSEDGGHTFTRMSTGLPIGFSAWATAVWTSPTVANDVLIGGTNQIYRSTNGGLSFFPISQGYIFEGDQPHIDHHCFVSDPQVPARVWACNDGGVYLAEDIYQASSTGGWENKNRSYRTNEYVAGVGDGPTGVIYGGTQDNGSPRSYLSDPEALAVPLIGGDGGPTQITPDGGHCFGQLPWFNIQRNNCSQSYPYQASNIVGGANPIVDACTYACFNTVSVYAPFVLDPNDASGNTIIAGGASLWRTRNARGNHDWFCIRGANGGPCPSPGGTPISGTPARAIAVAPGNPDVIWVAYSDFYGVNTSIFKTTNGTRDNPSWAPVTTPTPIDPASSRVVNQILIDPDNSNTVYLARGASPNNLLKTTNGGTNWEDITGPPPDQGGLPEVPINGIARHPNYPNKLYVGTGIGLYSSTNGGVTWDSELVGPAKVNVTGLSFMRGTTTLLAVTYGRAAWTAETNPLLSPIYVHFDRDGDGRADVGVFRPSDGTWRFRQSQDNFVEAQFGAEGDVVAVQDYDGDKKADMTVFRASEGAWYRLDSSDGSFHATYFGTAGDIVVPADYDGDGLGDEAVFRPSDQNWYIDLSTTGPTTVNWGLEDDKPVGADFDGDGLADIGVFRLKDGIWYLLTTGSGNQYYQFGMDGDMPVAADYDGDGQTDVAVWRPSGGDWYFLNSGGGVTGEHFGQTGDVPVPADYDGDGEAEVAVWRPTNGYWYFRNPDTGYSSFKFGADGDVPVSSYVLNRDAARMAPTGANASVPQIKAPTAEWFATGIPQERFARKMFKPGSMPGISDPDRIRKMLGQPARRAN